MFDTNLLDKMYLISDMHLGHTNIVKYCWRPFYRGNRIDTNLMDEYLLSQIDLLPRKSILINLGDLFFNEYNKDEGKKRMAINRMKDNKKICVLLMGNHDGKRVEKNVEYFKKLGFDAVYKDPIYIPELDLCFSHEPIVTPENSTIKNIHGHIHNNCAAGPRAFNASVEEIGYKPVKLTDVFDKLGITYPR